MSNLGDIFAKRMDQLGIKKRVEASLVVEEAQKNLEEIFGENVEKNLRVISFNKGVLKVAARTNVWASECQLASNKFINKPIERIVFEVGVTSLEDKP